jgi:hypothetical protein
MLASLLYNSPGVRLKNQAHWDYLLEALNAPLRGFLGWIAAGADDWHQLPVVLAAYYFLSLSVMLLKRRSERLAFSQESELLHYRPSLAHYSLIFLKTMAGLSMICGIFFSAWALYLRH